MIDLFLAADAAERWAILTVAETILGTTRAITLA